MQTLNQEAIDQMVKIIVREADPEAVILFGSHARRTARADSDVDLMVIEQEAFSAQRSRRAEYARLSMALRDFPFAKDILLYSRDEFEYWKDSPNHVVGRARREGRVLHQTSFSAAHHPERLEPRPVPDTTAKVPDRAGYNPILPNHVSHRPAAFLRTCSSMATSAQQTLYVRANAR